MKYLPYERITYKTNLSEQEVLTRLSGFVEPKKIGLGKNYIKEYEGSVNNNSFEISKVIQYRNSFLPQISGRIQKENDGTQIQVTMSLHAFVLFFLFVWCSFALLFFIGVSVRDIRAKEISVEFFLPLLMLLFVYALTMIGFKMESKKSKEDLGISFEAKILRES
ncbi:hypothetical protein FW781_14865 [Chryseobacterium panacisoli]|uniref:Uncharacterized protein n=1 Tax=Chryseobacterium panacisoli TaxID=1807141 RepID=A0A5D8ZLX9_9FLAO|nr:hypothetical protein [Chryseobacterium panacisoli]TZF95173.1 hypothetical protein FW781_14865 [Chryseobacterium panacisoli]